MVGHARDADSTPTQALTDSRAAGTNAPRVVRWDAKDKDGRPGPVHHRVVHDGDAQDGQQEDKTQDDHRGVNLETEEIAECRYTRGQQRDS